LVRAAGGGFERFTIEDQRISYLRRNALHKIKSCSIDPEMGVKEAINLVLLDQAGLSTLGELRRDECEGMFNCSR
jgi:hypothetical protein